VAFTFQGWWVKTHPTLGGECGGGQPPACGLPRHIFIQKKHARSTKYPTTCLDCRGFLGVYEAFKSGRAAV